MRTFVYVDGLNLYYLALRGTSFRWLNLDALCQAVLPKKYQIEKINYYTAYVSGRVDRGAPERQEKYLRALDTLPNVEKFFGNFLTNCKWAGLVKPLDFRPRQSLPTGFNPEVAYVWKSEEKGSDVNLGAHLVRDGLLKKFDAAAVLTNDTDLKEPIRIIKQEAKLPVILLCPNSKPAGGLVNLVDDARHIQPYLGACQFPDPIIKRNGKQLYKPPGW